tara:strand:+ start:49 stop:609 length:561 start_codon:yes stop_codon:yes gene_type:complete
MELKNEEQGMYDSFCVTDSIKSLANGNGITKGEIENIYKLYHELINNRSISSEKKAQAFYDLLFSDKDWNYSKENITLKVVQNNELDKTTQLIYFTKKKYYNIIGRLHDTFTPDVEIFGNQCISRINTFLTIVKNDYGKYKLMIIDVSSLCGTYDENHNRIKVNAYDLNTPVTILIGNYMTSLTIS